MNSPEGSSSHDSFEQDLTDLFNQFTEIAKAHQGSHETILGPNRAIEVCFYPAGYLAMETPDLAADDPSNLVDEIRIDIHEHEEPSIRITQTFRVVVGEPVSSEMVVKDLALHNKTVAKFYRGVVIGGMPKGGPFDRLDDSNELPKHLQPTKYADISDVSSTNPDDEMYLDLQSEFEMTFPIINPGFLKKFNAPVEVMTAAYRIVELAMQRSHAFNQSDAALLQECVNSLQT